MSKTAHCKCCGAEFERVSTKGRPPAFCSEDCKLAHRYPVQPKPPCGKCHECGGPVEPTLGKLGKWRNPNKYCGTSCESKAKERRYAILRHCEMCGSEFYRSKYEVRKYGGKFCSRTCNAKNATAHKIEKWERIRAGIEDPPQGCVDRWERARAEAPDPNVAALVNAEVVALRRIARRQGQMSRLAKIEVARIKRKHTGCEVCGQPVGYVFGRARLYCEAHMPLRNLFASMRDQRCVDLNRQHESFSRMDVFMHYGWACNACKVETPAYLIGTDPTHPHAPVVDHVLPIARGGEHTWDNVQLLCRSCNSIKGDSLNGELLNRIKGIGRVHK